MRLRRVRWEDGAACAEEGVDPEIFFEIENATDESRMPDTMKLAEALALCERCPLIERCFREGVYSRSLGIWGGTTAAERGVKYKLARPEVA